MWTAQTGGVGRRLADNVTGCTKVRLKSVRPPTARYTARSEACHDIRQEDGERIGKGIDSVHSIAAT